MVKLKDISIYFKSNCCINEGGHSSTLVRAMPQPTDAHRYIHYLYNQGTTCYATTITIGSKWLGKLSAVDQHEVFVNRIKEHIKYRSDYKYIYHFELTKSGQLHAHGVECGTNQGKFIESFYDFGTRNGHDQSFQLVKHMGDYLTYINKENEFPPIHNILKKDLHEMHQPRAHG